MLLDTVRSCCGDAVVRLAALVLLEAYYEPRMTVKILRS
jgi:hypothetical protein